MEKLQWIDVILIMAAVQGFFLSFILLKIKKGNRFANRVLSVLLGVVSLSIVGYLAIFVFQEWPMRAMAFLDTLAYTYAPLIYLYFRVVISPPIKNAKVIGLLFLPALLHFFFSLYIVSLSETALEEYAASGSLKIGMAISFMVFIGCSTYCIVMSIRLLYKFREQAARVASFRYNVNYFSIFLVALCVGYLISIVFALHTFFGIQFFSFTGFYIGWMIVPFLVYGITYVIMCNPEALQIEYLPLQKNTSQISEDEMTSYHNCLSQYMEVEQVYLNPKLTLQELALGIKISTNKLSKLINTRYACNFYDFVNQYRIEAFVEKLNNNEHETQTFMALAYDVGFNSKTTFNKMFKKIYGTTPRAYLKKSALS